MVTTPFAAAEVSLHAVFGSVDGWELPQHYGPVEAELARTREHGGLLDRSNWSKLKLTGKDALEFTNNYTTNQLKALKVGEGVATAITTWKGTMVDHVFALRAEDGLWIVGHPGAATAIQTALKTFMINVEVQLDDVTTEWGLLYAFGPHARDVIVAACGEAIPEVPHRLGLVTIAGCRVRVVRTWPASGDGYHLLVTAADAPPVFEALVRHGMATEFRPIGTEAWERLRVEEGIPAYGHEIGSDVTPWEARLADSVSMSKGCYLGQEVIARLANYDKVQRYLVGLRVAGDRTLPTRADILSQGQKVGVVTSAAPGVALGFVKTALAKAGTEVAVQTPEGLVPAVLETRPFWRDMLHEGVGARH